MSLAALAFCVAVTLHNLEEAIYLPAWSARAGRFHVAVGAEEFRFAVGLLTALAWIVAGAALWAGKDSVAAYLLCGYALAMVANVVVPHLAACVALRAYAPGTATALAFNLPAGALVMHVGLREGYIAFARFVWVGPAVALALAAAIPLLFALGRRLARKPSP